ncbi:hypothetical protein AgCh_010724 [Apium graveolens]
MNNGTAEYLAISGMTHLKTFGKAPGTFGDLATHLNRDIGKFILFEVEDNFGLDQVFDAPTPEHSVVIEHEYGQDMMSALVAAHEDVVNPPPQFLSTDPSVNVVEPGPPVIAKYYFNVFVNYNNGDNLHNSFARPLSEAWAEVSPPNKPMVQMNHVPMNVGGPVDMSNPVAVEKAKLDAVYSKWSKKKARYWRATLSTTLAYIVWIL